MSRGPGKWQRLILKALESYMFVVIRDLLPIDARQAEISALNRAAHKLEELGKIQLTHRQRIAKYDHHAASWWNGKSSADVWCLVAALPGLDIPRRYKCYSKRGIIDYWVTKDVREKLNNASCFEERCQIIEIYNQWLAMRGLLLPAIEKGVNVEQVAPAGYIPHLQD